MATALVALAAAGDSRAQIDLNARLEAMHKLEYAQAVQRADAAARASGNPCFDALEIAAMRYREFRAVNLADPPEASPSGGGKQICVQRYGGHFYGLEVRRKGGRHGPVRILRATFDGSPATLKSN